MNTENNKIIVEFLELQTQLHMCEHPLTGEYVDLEDLDFNSDWNCLMKVVEKIENLPNGRFKIEIYNNICRIYDHEEFDEVVELSENTKIEATCNACVEFIEWHNQQKS